jgi:glutathione S-transferase
MPEEKRDAAVIERAGSGLQRPLKVLDDALDGRDWLVGDSFSIADLNVAAVMLLMQMIEFDISTFANVQRWAQSCYARPALARAQSK